MKKYSLLLVLLAFCAFSLDEKIRWTWHDIPVIGKPETGGCKLQFGLRNDGVVVWREITNETNSPAEPKLGNIIYKFDSLITNNTKW